LHNFQGFSKEMKSKQGKDVQEESRKKQGDAPSPPDFLQDAQIIPANLRLTSAQLRESFPAPIDPG
jgi:hypothetical protein